MELFVHSHPDNIVTQYTYEHMCRKMQYCRRKLLPPTPNDLDEMDAYLRKNPEIGEFYRGSAESVHGGRAFVFIHPLMIDGLRRCTQLYYDDTFKVVPDRPAGLLQLYTIHFRKFQLVFYEHSYFKI